MVTFKNYQKYFPIVKIKKISYSEKLQDLDMVLYNKLVIMISYSCFLITIKNIYKTVKGKLPERVGRKVMDLR